MTPRKLDRPPPRRRWRFYTSAAGRKPVREFLDKLPDADAAGVAAAMAEVRTEGVAIARHLRGDIYELRADGGRQTYRLLFAVEGRRGQVLLALEAFSKKTQKTPLGTIELAMQRLTDWRARGSPS
jgi:phage-related protein